MLAKMIGMLGSEHDGEVLAAVRKIGSVLSSNKLSFADLSALVRGPLPGAAPYMAPAATTPSGFTGRPNVTPNPEAVVRFLFTRRATMPDKEFRFVTDAYTRLRDRGYLSLTVKQIEWLLELNKKYEVEKKK